MFPSAADSGQDEEPHSEINAALAAVGLVAEPGALRDEDEFYLWPCNLETFQLWLSVQTQWRISDGHCTGLDYQGVQVCLIYQVRKKDRAVTLAMVQAMERAALDEWAQQR